MLSSTAVGEPFDVGTGPSTGIVVRVISHTGSGGGSIDSFVIGGVTLTALPQASLAGWGANERLFYGVALSLSGNQAWTAAVGSATRIAVQLFAAHSVVSFEAGPTLALLNAALNQSLTTDANSIQVGLLTSNAITGTVAATGNTMQRLSRLGNFYRDLIWTEDRNDTAMQGAVSGFGFTPSWLGRIVKLQGSLTSAALPTWVPAAGEVAMLTVANGGLANNFRDECAPYYSDYYYVRTTNTYGGCFKNPFWGSYGAAMFFSGGHGNINDNSVTMAEYGVNAVTFKRVTDPTPWFGRGTDSDTKVNNSAAGSEVIKGVSVPGQMDVISAPGDPARVFNYGISTIDGAPGSSHTYGSGDFIGPADGGAANGTHLRVWSPALNRNSQNGAVSALALDFVSTTAATGTRSWRKESLNRLNETGNGAAPVLTQWVPRQQRVYVVTNGLTRVWWFDKATGTYVTGSGVGFDFDLADGSDGGTLFHVPERGLLVCAYRRAGVIELQWMDVTVAQPTKGGTATLSTRLNVLDPWGAATWCPDNNRIILGAISGDNAAVYEVQIPDTLSSAWTVTRAPFGAGQTLPDMNTTGEFKRFHYDHKIKSIFYFAFAKRADQGHDVAYVYRPRFT
ncbi:MAG: hypothetical protein LH480_10245 [Rubrivivax sp.]|nr:hypothetical protein [Rubrivivax sp.]